MPCASGLQKVFGESGAEIGRTQLAFTVETAFPPWTTGSIWRHFGCIVSSSMLLVFSEQLSGSLLSVMMHRIVPPMKESIF